MPARAGAFLLGAVLLAGAIWALVSGERPVPPIEPGVIAPAFDLPSLDGETRGLADLRGSVVLINFWATWCKPCEDEMPAMDRLYGRLADQDFELLAISVDDGRDEVEAFQERMGLTFPLLLDPGKDVARQYQSFRYPESYLVDRDGVLVERYIGPRDWDSPAYVERIERLLTAGPDPAR